MQSLRSHSQQPTLLLLFWSTNFEKDTEIYKFKDIEEMLNMVDIEEKHPNPIEVSNGS